MKSQLVWLARLAFIVAFLGLNILSFLSPDQASSLDDFIPWDKAEHFIAYYVVASLALVAFPRVPTAVLFILLFTQSALIEALQPYFGRGRDVYDLVANCAGLAAVVAPLCAYKLRWFLPGTRDIDLGVSPHQQQSGTHERI